MSIYQIKAKHCYDCGAKLPLDHTSRYCHKCREFHCKTPLPIKGLAIGDLSQNNMFSTKPDPYTRRLRDGFRMMGYDDV